MTLTPYAAEWFARADEDLRALTLMLEEGSLPNTICFHAQQASEKALKGYLAANEQHVRKTHALDELVAACAKIDDAFELVRADAMYLNDFYTEARYPGDFPSFTMEQARKAHDAAQRIVRFVRERIEA